MKISTNTLFLKLSINLVNLISKWSLVIIKMKTVRQMMKKKVYILIYIFSSSTHHFLFYPQNIYLCQPFSPFCCKLFGTFSGFAMLALVLSSVLCCHFQYFSSVYSMLRSLSIIKAGPSLISRGIKDLTEFKFC